MYNVSMNIYQLKKQIGLNVFTSDMIKPILEREYEQPVIKINAMVKKGELIRLKRGTYALGEEYRDHPLNMISIANMLHKPSYVSYEYALSYHGLIPERVYTVTSATSYRSEEYNTQIGSFSYTKVPLKAYSIGLDWKFDEHEGGYMIATPEKALCDHIYTDKRIVGINKNEIMEYLQEDLRIDWEDLKRLDTTLLWKISMAYTSPRLRDMAASIKKRKKDG
jgi:predicted transcriptional regulator of viral defense system